METLHTRRSTETEIKGDAKFGGLIIVVILLDRYPWGQMNSILIVIKRPETNNSDPEESRKLRDAWIGICKTVSDKAQQNKDIVTLEQNVFVLPANSEWPLFCNVLHKAWAGRLGCCVSFLAEAPVIREISP